MTWNPIPHARAAAQRVAKAFAGDIPEVPLSETIRLATQSQNERIAQNQRIAVMQESVRILSNSLEERNAIEESRYERVRERVSEMIEARQMCGSGAWLTESVRAYADRAELPTKLKEAVPVGAIGAFGDVEQALQNLEWRREINLSWMEFSRWGIQQIILISRLYYMKHPWIRRGINLSAAYVFGQGVKVSSPNPKANEIITAFFERNKKTLGMIALIEAERKKSYDGNLFWVLFADKENSGDVKIREIDATEIQEIVCDPNDSDTPWYYRRVWTARTFDVNTGTVGTKQEDAWYPAIWYDPPVKPKAINGTPVMWNYPVKHRKCGHVAKWHFGCPRVYPALDYSREGKRVLEAWCSVWQALKQYALTITTKGGMQALAGIKQQLGTTVGPASPIFDYNPAAVPGSTFGVGTGTKLEAFKTTGADQAPSEGLKEIRNLVACCLEIPPTWLGDMETSNLSTATTLDRPTELGFSTKQEEWQEDFVDMARYQLVVSAGAANGKLRECYGPGVSAIEIREAPRRMKDCHWVYEASKKQNSAVIEILATFPAIREGDRKLNVDALVESMTLNNKGGQVVGIDEKVGVRELYRANGIDGGDEYTEDQYPEATYDPERSQEIEPPPIANAPPFNPGGQPQVKAEQPQPNPENPAIAPKKSASAKEATSKLIAALESWDAERVDDGALECQVSV